LSHGRFEEDGRPRPAAPRHLCLPPRPREAAALGARLSNASRAPSSRASRGTACEFGPLFAGGAGLPGACSHFSDTLPGHTPLPGQAQIDFRRLPSRPAAGPDLPFSLTALPRHFLAEAHRQVSTSVEPAAQAREGRLRHRSGSHSEILFGTKLLGERSSGSSQLVGFDVLRPYPDDLAASQVDALVRLTI